MSHTPSVEPPDDVYLAAATASVRTEGVNDGYIASTARDEPFRAAVRVAYAAGRLPAAHLLPLLELTADEMAALRLAAGWWADAAAAEAIRDDQPDDTDPSLIAALDKLTTTEETPDA